MDREHFFKTAKWIGASERTAEIFSIVRGRFTVDEINRASLNILGLGFFKCYINGQCINPDTFLPLSSEYENTKEPVGEAFSGKRMYVPHFDITPFVKKGENRIAVHFGGGWYTHRERVMGLLKVIFCITVEGNSKTEYFVSDEHCKVCKSYVCAYNLVSTERHDLTDFDELCLTDAFDDSNFENAVVTEQPDTEYFETDCPIDTLAQTLSVQPVGQGERGKIYDCGRNTTGYPVLKISAAKGERVCVYFSEKLRSDGKMDSRKEHDQQFSVLSDGTKRTVQPEFTWFGFRYLEVEGCAEVKCVKEIHADVPVTSSFDCDNETLNWIYKTFTHTMLCNMHIGHPSDCPHIERRGYTGDGQLTCHAALSVFGAKAFYEKWLCDIADGQDKNSGHIQYTAPYILSGGGPGGWGSAIVEVPYRLYRHYGDAEILKKYYGNMRRYIDFLDAHSEFGLVTSDVNGAWCLGDWCAPNILYPDKNITCCGQQIFTPIAYVNTYFKVKSLLQMCEIARVIGEEKDIPVYEQKAQEGKKAIRAAYFNAFDGNYVMNAQGANVYALDLNIGREADDGYAKTYENTVNYYKKLAYLDTGIFATDILIRTLFENGDGDLAVELLTNDGAQGFENWRKHGVTTFFEFWDSENSRSYNHPMFGAVTAYLFEYLLGIKQKEHSAGYRSIVIAPQALVKFQRMAGSMELPTGKICVKYEKKNGVLRFEIVIPPHTEVVFEAMGLKKKLVEGTNTLEIPCETA